MVTNQDIFKKFNIDYKGEYEIEIPQLVGGTGLAKLFAELGFNEGVEIGTDKGEFAEVLLTANPNLKLRCIDPWEQDAYEPKQQPESNEQQEFFSKRYEETLERLKKFPNCDVVRVSSMEAIHLCRDNSLDFVYIDGNHDFLNVTQDIHFWLKKIKPGGILAGHDFVKYPSAKFNHVQKVVRGYTTSYHLLPVFLVTPTNKGMKQDRFRSWFICKP